MALRIKKKDGTITEMVTPQHSKPDPDGTLWLLGGLNLLGKNNELKKKLSRKDSERDPLPPLPGYTYKEYKDIAKLNGNKVFSESTWKRRRERKPKKNKR